MNGRYVSWAVVLWLVLACATTAWGQSVRGSRSISTPGQFRTPGASSSSYSFTSNSYGLGSLQSSANTSTDILRSGGLTYQRGGAGGGSYSSSLPEQFRGSSGGGGGGFGALYSANVGGPAGGYADLLGSSGLSYGGPRDSAGLPNGNLTGGPSRADLPGLRRGAGAGAGKGVDPGTFAAMGLESLIDKGVATSGTAPLGICSLTVST